VSFTATPRGNDRIELNWAPAADGICTDRVRIDGYALKSGDRVLETTTNGTSYTAKSLQKGVEYAFTVTAINAKGDSDPATAMATISS
jgi:Fibronectin type III domain